VLRSAGGSTGGASCSSRVLLMVDSRKNGYICRATAVENLGQGLFHPVHTTCVVHTSVADDVHTVVRDCTTYALVIHLRPPIISSHWPLLLAPYALEIHTASHHSGSAQHQ
jgi:hypothetical protein